MALPQKTTKSATSVKPPVKAASEAVTYDWSAHEATGFEKTKTEDLGIPFLVILQKGSAEVDRTHKDHSTKKIEGAEAGDIINTVTRKVISTDGEPAFFIPCSYERVFIEWKPRESGGGMVRQHLSDSILQECTRNAEDNRDYLPNGNIIVTTGCFFGLLVGEDGNLEKCVISMSSTQLKKARLWLNMMMQIKVDGPNGRITPPMFSHKYSLATTPEQNKDGSWYGWHIESAGMLKDSAVIQEAAGVAKQMAAGARPQLAESSSSPI